MDYETNGKKIEFETLLKVPSLLNDSMMSLAPSIGLFNKKLPVVSLSLCVNTASELTIKSLYIAPA
jgi:hypothetical protein